MLGRHSDLPRGGALFSEYLEALARRRQNGLWLTGIHISEGGQTLRFEGSATEASRVPDFLEGLSDEFAYHGRTFSTMLLNRPPEHDWKVDFLLSTVREEGGS